jgi:hypothetical protein
MALELVKGMRVRALTTVYDRIAPALYGPVPKGTVGEVDGVATDREDGITVAVVTFGCVTSCVNVYALEAF